MHIFYEKIVIFQDKTHSAVSVALLHAFASVFTVWPKTRLLLCLLLVFSLLGRFG